MSCLISDNHEGASITSILALFIIHVMTPKSVVVVTVIRGVLIIIAYSSNLWIKSGFGYEYDLMSLQLDIHL